MYATRALFALLIASSAAISFEASAEAGLLIRATCPTAHYSDPSLFRLAVEFHNRSDAPLLVLPALLRRHYRAGEAGTAEYVPYPGPPISPWSGAFALAEGASESIELRGMRDGDGIWRLTAGRFHVSVRYTVDADLAAGQATATSLSAELRGVALWIGHLQSDSMRVVYGPEDP